MSHLGDDVRRLGESSAVDMARLMELIATGAVAGPEASAGMINILRRQQYLDQVPRYFNYNPYAQDLALEQPYSVACKTGFFPGTRVDAGLLFLAQDVTIAYCAMTDGSADTSISAEAEGLVTNGQCATWRACDVQHATDHLDGYPRHHDVCAALPWGSRTRPILCCHGCRHNGGDCCGARCADVSSASSRRTA